MDHSTLETFLAIVSTNSTSRAADLLYISQSSVSKRLKMLEEEIGMKLIVRNRGKRTVELTAAGMAFLPLAEQWLGLHHQTVQLREGATRSKLAVASIDSLNTSVLPPIYRKLLEQSRTIDLVVTTNQTVNIYEMIECHLFDVGFVLTKLQRPNILVLPFITQKYKLIRYCRTPPENRDPVHPTSLDPAFELFQPWGPDFQQWHEYWWPSGRHYVKVDSASLMQGLFHQDGFWTIVPDSIAALYRDAPNCYAFDLSVPPPDRVCYRIVNRFPRESCKAALATFERLLAEELGPWA